MLAYLRYGKYAAVDFIDKEGLLMAPAYAVPRMLADAGLKLQDFDFYEIHEAFEAQVLHAEHGSRRSSAATGSGLRSRSERSIEPR